MPQMPTIRNRASVHLLGRTFPQWAVALALILATAGASTGVVLIGSVSGVISATVGQALLIETVQVSEADNAQGFRSDDRTRFRALAEINTGDDYKVHLALANESDDALVGELSLHPPEGVTLSVKGSDGVGNVVRMGPFTWLFDLDANEIDTIIDMTITVALNDEMLPGFYKVEGEIRQIDMQGQPTPTPTATPIPMANLAILKSGSPDPVTLGDQLTYSVQVVNNGPSIATGVAVTDVLPASVTFVSATPSQGTCSGSTTVICSLGVMNNGNSATITIVVIPSTVGTITNTATATSSITDPVSADNTASVSTVVAPPPTANLAILKTDSPDPVLIGENLTYSLLVTNAGPDSATGVVVTDSLPAGVSYVSASSSQGGCVGTSTISCSVGTLGNGASATVSIVVVPVITGTITNTASVASDITDPVIADNSTSVTTTVDPQPSADLVLVKAASQAIIGGYPYVTYTITVSNSGPNTATSVVMTDAIPTTHTVVNVTPSQGGCSGTSTITCNLGSMTSGGTATIVIETGPCLPGTTTNTAYVTSSLNDPDITNNSSSVTVTVV